MSVYGITISPRYRTLNPQTLYDQDSHAIRRQLNKCSHHYILYPEFDTSSRLHYHGIIRMDDLRKYHHIKYCLDAIGWTKCDKIKTHMDHLRWIIYCQKNGPQLMDPIIYKHLNKIQQLTPNQHNLDTNNIYKFLVSSADN